MPTVQFSDEQVLDLVEQLAPQQKRSVLLALAERARTGRERRMAFGEEQIIRLCAERGLDWNAMSEEEREGFINSLVHEDRPCQP